MKSKVKTQPCPLQQVAGRTQENPIVNPKIVSHE